MSLKLPSSLRRVAATLVLAGGWLWAAQAAAQSGAIAGQPAVGPATGGGVVLHSGAVFSLASAPTLAGGSLPGGVAGGAYNQSLSATGGTPPYSYALAAGSSLPAGMVLLPGGVFSGAPTAAGTYSFTVQVTDAAAQTTSVTYLLVVAPAGGGGGAGGPVAVPLGGPLASVVLALLVVAGARRRLRASGA